MKVEEFTQALLAQTQRVILGKEAQIRLILAALLADGHVLLDDLPGSGKTTLVKTLSLALGCDFKRIQFVPDLLPADILGAKVFNQKTGDFEFLEGPVRTNLLLADEINRAIPRTQSALLEAMEERQVTVDGRPLPLPRPFLVLATQNPVEMESTFPLPAAQLDRFFLCLSLGYPDPAQEAAMLESRGSGQGFEGVQAVAGPDDLIHCQKAVDQVTVSEEVRRYIVALVEATRRHPGLRLGASPRGSLCLYRGAKAWAAMAGRDYVLPDDVKALVKPVLAHRLVLTGEARFAGAEAGSILEEILAATPVPPQGEEALLHEQARG